MTTITSLAKGNDHEIEDGHYWIDQTANTSSRNADTYSSHLFDIKTTKSISIKEVANKQGCFDVESFTKLRAATFRSIIGIKTKGKYYYECELLNKRTMRFGIGQHDPKLNNKLLKAGGNKTAWAFGCLAYGFYKIHNETQVEYGRKIKGDVIGIGIDLGGNNDNSSSIEFWMNGKSLGKAYDNINIDLNNRSCILYPMFTLDTGGKFILRFESRHFKYPTPNGYLPFKYDLHDPTLLSKQSGIKAHSSTGDNDTSRRLRNQEIGQELRDYLNKDEAQKFVDKMQQLSNSEDFVDKDFDYVLNEMRYNTSNTTLLSLAAHRRHTDVCKLLVTKFNADVNARNGSTTSKNENENKKEEEEAFDRKTPLYYACRTNNLELIDFFMSNGSRAEDCQLGYALGDEGSIEGFKMILNLSNKYKYSWNWNRFVNYRCNLKKVDYNRNLFLFVCERGFVDLLKFLVSLEESNIDGKFTTKMNRLSCSTQFGMNGLQRACFFGATKMIHYLCDEIYCEKGSKDDPKINPNSKKCVLNINYSKQRRSALRLCIEHGGKDNVEIAQKLIDTFPNTIDIRFFFDACYFNKWKIVRWFMTNEFTKNKIQLNKKHLVESFTPLTAAIKMHAYEACRELVTNDKVDFFENWNKAETNNNSKKMDQNESKNDSGHKTVAPKESCMDFAAFYGNIAIFSLLVRTYFERENIVDIDSLNKNGIFCQENIDTWYSYCEEQENTAFYSFLTQLINNGIKTNNFEFIQTLLNAGDEDRVNGQEKEQTSTMDSKYENARKDMKIARYLFDNLKKQSLIDIGKTINQGLLEQKCGFNDSLLFLSKLINNNEFNKALEDTTRICLVKPVTKDESKTDTNSDGTQLKNKNDKKHQFFKNNLLSSNIFASYVSDSNEDSGTSIEDETVTLFEQINNNVCLSELKLQQEFIKDEMLKIEKNSSKGWDDVMGLPLHLATRPNLAVKQSMVPTHSETEIPNDIIDGYVGVDEYDHNGYLTELLIAAHKVDPLFQDEAQKIFGIDYKNAGINCSVAAAPVKTKERCVSKAKIDYKSKPYPHSRHILDFVRCSVVFDTIEDLINGYYRFYNKYRAYQPRGIIRCISRIKNDFVQLKDINVKSIAELELNQMSYRDIKFNVTLQGPTQKLIGEIQFLPKFMLKVWRVATLHE